MSKLLRKIRSLIINGLIVLHLTWMCPSFVEAHTTQPPKEDVAVEQPQEAPPKTVVPTPWDGILSYKPIVNPNHLSVQRLNSHRRIEVVEKPVTRINLQTVDLDRPTQGVHLYRADFENDEILKFTHANYRHNLDPQQLIYASVNTHPLFALEQTQYLREGNPYQLHREVRHIWGLYSGYIDEEGHWILTLPEDRREAVLKETIQGLPELGYLYKKHHVLSGWRNAHYKLMFGLYGTNIFWHPINDERFFRFDLPRRHPFYGMSNRDIRRILRYEYPDDVVITHPNRLRPYGFDQDAILNRDQPSVQMEYFTKPNSNYPGAKLD